MKTVVHGLLSVLGAAFVASGGVAEERNVAVVFPDLREPFAAIYRDYIEGIDQKIDGQLWTYPHNGDGVDKLKNSVESGRHGVYISLGNKSTQLVNDLKPGKPIVAAVTNKKYEGMVSAGILLKPSASVYLDNLFEVIAKTRRVFTVFNPENDQELIDEASAFLTERGVDFVAIPASDVREAAAGYRSIVSQAQSYDSIWLMADKSIFDSTLLSIILDVAWDKKLAVFSSNPVFVKHGALFAIYPDNKGVGNSLGLMAMSAVVDRPSKLEPLKDIRLAMNERTRNHLGLSLSAETRSKIDLTLPGN